MEKTAPTPGIEPESITHQYPGLFLLFMGFSFLDDEGRGQLAQACGCCCLSLPLGQSGQLLLHQGLLMLKAKVGEIRTVLTFNIYLSSESLLKQSLFTQRYWFLLINDNTNSFGMNLKILKLINCCVESN